MKKREYPEYWHDLAHYIRYFRDESTCQICGTKQHHTAPDGTYIPVLQVAHLDHDCTNNSHSNLLTMCLPCHVRYDKGQHLPNPELNCI